jgi:hypothetical protein
MKWLCILWALGGVARASEPSCSDALGAVRAHLTIAQRAKQPSKTEERKARAAWAAVPTSCRGGAWYVAAANIFRHPGGAKTPLAADGVALDGARQALEAGLAAAPADPDLLVYVAHLARVAPTLTPPLPKDACAALGAADAAMRGYVCAVQAIADGRWADAGRALDDAATPRFPDVAELRAAVDAHEAAGSHKPVPEPVLRCDPFCPLEGWRTASRAKPRRARPRRPGARGAGSGRPRAGSRAGSRR